MRKTMLAMLLAGAVTLGGCDEDGANEAATTEVRDSAGIAIVVNGATGAWDADGWTVEEELSIGVAEGDPNYQFGGISAAGIDVASDGRIFVLDQQAQEISVFDSEGTYLSSMGGAGSGPGELSPGTGGLLVGAGDTLYVPDLGLQRVTRFAPDGAEAGSFPIDLQDGIPLKWALTPDHRLLAQVRSIPMTADEDAPQENRLVILDGSGEVTDTFLQLPVGETFQGSGDAFSMRLFSPEAVWGQLSDGRVASGMNGEYRFEIRSADGELERIVQMPVEPEPVTDSDQRRILGMMRQLYQDQGVPPEAVEQIMGGVDFAETFPAYANIMGGPSGSIWVQHVQNPEDTQEEDEADMELTELQDLGAPGWDVFDSEGRYLGVVQVPEAFTPVRFLDDVIWGIQRDEFDVQHVAKLRIGTPDGSADAPVAAENP